MTLLLTSLMLLPSADYKNLGYSYGYVNSIQEEHRYLIYSQEEFKDTYLQCSGDQSPLPILSFEKGMVFLVLMGKRQDDNSFIMVKDIKARPDGSIIVIVKTYAGTQTSKKPACPYHFVWISRGVTPDKVTVIEE